MFRSDEKRFSEKMSIRLQNAKLVVKVIAPK